MPKFFRNFNKIRPDKLFIKKTESKINKHESISLFVSLLAIIIALITLYFQFFYEKNEVRVSFISVSYNADTLFCKFIYHNNGTKYATVLKNEIYINNRESSWKLPFVTNTVYYKFSDDNFDPIILMPNQQVYKGAYGTIGKQMGIRYRDTLYAFSYIDYIDRNGINRNATFSLGWFLLDNQRKIRHRYFIGKNDILP